MSIKFRLNGEHIAYIDEELLKSYRELLHIPEKRKNSRVLRDIMYRCIIGDEYYSDEVEKCIKQAKFLAKYHKFKDVGDFMEYFMHREIERELKTCGNCPMYDKQTKRCLDNDVLVASVSNGCNNDNFFNTFDKETQQELLGLLQKGENV